jgi:DNA-binding transcriptional ArsR family regulator
MCDCPEGCLCTTCPRCALKRPAIADTLCTLRALRDANEPDGSRASELAAAIGRSIDDTQLDLDRYRRDGLVVTERDAIGTVWYSLSASGHAILLGEMADTPSHYLLPS